MNNPKSANKFLFLFIIYYIFITIVLSLATAFLPFLESNTMLIVQDLFLILVPIIIYLFFSKRKLSELIPHKRLDVKNALYVIMITLLSWPLMSFVSALSSVFFTTYINDSIFEYIDNLPLLSCVLAFGIMPAIFEELMCRGVILSNYKTTSPLVMYILSGIAFGIIHMNFQQMSYAIVAGIFLAFYVHYTNSIYASMLAHFFINTSQVIVAKLTIKFAPDVAMAEAEPLTTQSIISTAIMVIIFMPFLILTVKRFIKRNQKAADEYLNNEVGTNKKFIDIYFILAVILFLILSLGMEYLISKFNVSV